MRQLFSFAVLVCLLSSAGCTKQASEEAPAAEEANSGEAAIARGTTSDPATASAEPTDEPEMDYGDWLRLPEDAGPRYNDAYPMLVQSAIAGDPNGQMNLAMVSQQIASTLARNGNIESAYQFILQSGRALRLGLPAGAKLLPDTAIAGIFFNEACVLARLGKLKEAESALNEAVDSGFTNLAAISNDEDLEPLRAMEGFAERFDTWQQSVKRKVTEKAQSELAAGESFPFSFAGIDLAGVEQSLSALNGKVVIVDIWGTWCPPCRAEIPSFIKLQQELGAQGFQMIGLNYERKESEEENLKAVVDFVQEFGVNYPCILGDKATLEQVPAFQGYPTTLFIDKTGTVRLKAVGLHDYLYLEAVVKQLLSE